MTKRECECSHCDNVEKHVSPCTTCLRCSDCDEGIYRDEFKNIIIGLSKEIVDQNPSLNVWRNDMK